MTEVIFGEVGAEFARHVNAFKEALHGRESLLGEIEGALDQELLTFNTRGFLTLAFVGEYSAGKSTIVAALTGKRDIPIGSDIKTDQTQEYDWNGIKVIDTPGLWTERKDHDATTYAAIERSDLLAFCLTHHLFDAITVENFRQLAYDRGYQCKMMLIVNKLSAESSKDEDAKISNYRESLAAALAPHALDAFTVCFVDALDYVYGVDQDDQMYLELSRFEEFKKELSAFAVRRGALARLDTPIRIVLGKLDAASTCLARNSDEDGAYLELLGRLSRVVELERSRLRSRVSAISLEVAAGVFEEGTKLTRIVGLDAEFEAKCRNAIAQIEKLADEGARKMEIAATAADEAIQREVGDVLKSPFGLAFVARLDVPDSLGVQNAGVRDGAKRLKEQVGRLGKIANRAGREIEKQGVAKGAGRAAGQQGVFIRAGQAAGGNLHRAVYAVGKFFGANFKPWQAVNIAKTLGNVMKCVGPILTVFTVILDVADEFQQIRNQNEAAAARRQVSSEFRDISDQLEQQFRGQLEVVEAELYAPIEQEIYEARTREEVAIAKSNDDMGQILEIRRGLERLLGKVAKMVRC